MTGEEFLINTFGMTEEQARIAVENGFRASELAGNDGIELFKKESGIGAALADAAKNVNGFRKSLEEAEKGL